MRSTNLIALLLLLVLCSCNNVSKTKGNKREEILRELAYFQDRLPYTVPGTRFTIKDISIDNDIVAYTCSVYDDDWKTMSMESDVANSDRNMARVLSNVSNEVVDIFIEHGIGLKYIYTSEETGKTLLEIEMSADKLKDIKDKVENGELEAYTILEIAQMELAKLEIPSQIDEGIWMTDAYIKGHNVYYVATIEAELEPSDLTSSDKAEMKENVLESLKGEWLIMNQKNEIIKENVHFIYVFKDNRGREFAKLDISPYDL